MICIGVPAAHFIFVLAPRHDRITTCCFTPRLTKLVDGRNAFPGLNPQSQGEFIGVVDQRDGSTQVKREGLVVDANTKKRNAPIKLAELRARRVNKLLG